jgi:hypothetical protein
LRHVSVGIVKGVGEGMMRGVRGEGYVWHVESDDQRGAEVTARG